LQAMAIYAFLLVFFRFSGRRTLAELTNFDFVLLLILGEATQQALLGEDYSFINAAVVIVTLLLIDICLSLLKERAPRLERWLDGLPLVIVENGCALKDRMKRARVDEDDILESARKLQGLERLDQIKYAVLERNGGISVIPKQS